MLTFRWPGKAVHLKFPDPRKLTWSRCHKQTEPGGSIRAVRRALPNCVIAPWVPRDEGESDAGHQVDRTSSESGGGGRADSGVGKPIGAPKDADSFAPEVKADETRGKKG